MLIEQTKDMSSKMVISVKDLFFTEMLKSKVSGAFFCSSFLLYMYRKRESIRRFLCRQRPFSKVLFFPEHSPCYDFIFKPQGCTKENCFGSHDKNSSFNQLISCILNARKTIYLCMYSLTCKELSDAILLKFGQGVDVRMITDTTYMLLSGSRSRELMEAGIQVRHHKQQHYMHNKFVVIDNYIAITGSANWTQAAIIGNQENVLISNRAEIVDPYTEEFFRLWKSFNAEPEIEVKNPNNETKEEKPKRVEIKEEIRKLIDSDDEEYEKFLP